MKTYDETLNEAAEKSIDRNMYELHEADARVRQFKAGALWQKQREEKLIARLKELGQAMPPNSISMHINRALKSHEENGD